MHLPISLRRDIIPQHLLLHSLFQFSADNQLSIAVWQLPGSQKKQLLLSKQARRINRDEVILEELSSGFIFAPFDRKQDAIFLDADYLFTFAEGQLLNPQSEKEERAHELLSGLNLTPEAKFKFYTRPNSPEHADTSREQFITLVTQAMHLIDQGAAEKIVPSRTRHIVPAGSLDLVTSFEKLCTAFPNAMVSFVSTPEGGSWIGATPELLVCVDDSKFKTVALAGTQPYHDGTNLKQVAWTQKEIEEQALVERYIISCFKKIRLREYDEHGPKTVVAGNLMHLKSEFTVDMKETNFPQLGTIMLRLLHPTSAVCGMPLEPALEFLNKHEGYNRSFYSGFLGPVNIQDQIHIFVNLRCMQLRENDAVLYAGAGVTSDSIPEKEWEETEMKMNTLMRVLFG